MTAVGRHPQRGRAARRSRTTSAASRGRPATAGRGSKPPCSAAHRAAYSSQLSRLPTPPPAGAQTRAPRREVLPDLAGRRRPVEGDEVDARHALVEQPRAHLAGLLDAEPAHRLRVVGDPLEPRGQRRRERRAGELLGALDRAHLGHRHDAGQDRGVAAGRGHPVAQPQVVVGVEEHLGDREVGAGPALADEVVGVGVDVGRARVLVRERGHADAEVARLADQAHQLLGVEHALGVLDPLAHRVARRVAAHGQDVADARRRRAGR